MYFNGKALEDGDFALNYAMLFTSHHFNALKEHLQSSDGNSIFRAHILNMLQKNYSSLYPNTNPSVTFTTQFFLLFLPLFLLHFSDADNLRDNNVELFYNSITLLGEFYNRLHQKTHPILIMGSSLFELLTKQLRREIDECTKDSAHVFDVQFSRLILAQVS